MKKTLIVLMAVAGGAMGVAPVAQAECCEGEFDWAEPYVDALRNHRLGYLPTIAAFRRP